MQRHRKKYMMSLEIGTRINDVHGERERIYDVHGERERIYDVHGERERKHIATIGIEYAM